VGCDFVFRENGDGQLEFVGDFEGLYRDVPDPWDQSAQQGQMASYYHYSRTKIADALLQQGVRNAIGLEVGCGLGYALTEISKSMVTTAWEGIDKSAEAVKRARVLHPHLTFHHDDIVAPTRVPNNYYDIIALNQILWYVLEDLDLVFSNCYRLLVPGGLLLISQAFLRQQRYGLDQIDGFNGLLRFVLGWCCQDRFQVVDARYNASQKYIHHDGLLLLRKVSSDGRSQ